LITSRKITFSPLNPTNRRRLKLHLISGRRRRRLSSTFHQTEWPSPFLHWLPSPSQAGHQHHSSSRPSSPREEDCGEATQVPIAQRQSLHIHHTKVPSLSLFTFAESGVGLRGLCVTTASHNSMLDPKLMGTPSPTK
ncbi:hypothetical protein LINPERHAP2_LOCUS14173, partial [Linum perenne]